MSAKGKIQKYKFKPGLPMELEIIAISDLYSKNRQQMTLPHRTDFYHILWIERGSATHLVDFNPIKLERNSILFINKSKVHLFDGAGKFDGKVILFTDNFFCRNHEDIEFINSTILFNDLLETKALKAESIGDELKVLRGLMQSELIKSPHPLQHSILQNYLHNFLLLCDLEKRKQGFKEIPKGADKDYAVLFVTLVNEHFSKVRSVQAYAGMIHISEKRLSRATSLVLGKPPKEIINDRVLLEIKRLLVHTNQSIKEIGFLVGFQEPTNFIKYFRQHTNTTPSEFREEFVH